MKRIMIIALCGLFTVKANAQNETEKTGGFQKDHLFTGGNVALGFGSGQTSFGIGPYFGYSFNKYIDAAVSLNYNYVSQKQYVSDYYNSYYLGKARANAIGPGAFVRIFPVKFIYIQAQFEENFSTYKFIPAEGSGYAYSKETFSTPSLLLGAGLASGRSEYNRSYGYISLLFDVAKNPNSPYLDAQGDVTPIIRAGYNIALFQGSQRKRGGGGRYRRRRF